MDDTKEQSDVLESRKKDLEGECKDGQQERQGAKSA